MSPPGRSCNHSETKEKYRDRLLVGAQIFIAMAAIHQVEADYRTSLYEEIVVADKTFVTASR